MKVIFFLLIPGKMQETQSYCSGAGKACCEKCQSTGLESIPLGSTSCAVADPALLFHCIADRLRIPQNRVFQLSHRSHKMV